MAPKLITMLTYNDETVKLSLERIPPFLNLCLKKRIKLHYMV